MCGIAGVIKTGDRDIGQDDIRRLLEGIRGRGPDDEGLCVISSSRKHFEQYVTERSDKKVKDRYPALQNLRNLKPADSVLLHSRYAIIDLSEAGHQPFVSGDGSLVGVFNGEIYNYIELKEDLKGQGVEFKTSTDTEVLIEGYRYYGDELWSKMNGFWAVVMYDRTYDRFIISRDRVGVAPLYYRFGPDGFFFSSYLHPLAQTGQKKAGINNDVLLGFLQTGIKDHDNSTFYEGIKTFPAGKTYVIDREDFDFTRCRRTSFWSLPRERLSTKDLSFDEAVGQFRDIFFDAVKIRLRADVKVAFELSGGLDSSSVVAAAAEMRQSNVTTYTAKVEGADEEPYARSLCSRYALDYRVLESSGEGFVKDYPDFARLMEEPYDNPNAYTHHRMLKKMKSEGVDVVVTGAGGDEVLAGYEASFWPKVYREMRRRDFASYCRADLYEFIRRFRNPHNAKKTLTHYAVDPFKRILRQEDESDEKEPAEVTRALEYQRTYRSLNFHQSSLFHFEVALLPYYMRSSDHFTMGIPIEHRFPLLDYRVVQFGLTMPPEYLFRNGWTKYLLRKAMEPYLPSKIVWRRRKMGFTFPYQRYFQKYRQEFEPVFATLKNGEFSSGRRESYEALLNQHPQKLWRYISAAVWLKENGKS